MSGRTARYIAGIALVLGACSGSDDEISGGDATAPTTPPTTEADAPEGSSAAPPTTTEPADEADAGGGDTVATDPPTTTMPAAAVDVGRTVVQTTPTSGNPATPTLAWEPVDGAVFYTVVVADAEGSTWWSWEGAELEVVLGGVASGPAALQTEPGATWTVFAHGDDDRMLAASPRRPLDP